MVLKRGGDGDVGAIDLAPSSAKASRWALSRGASPHECGGPALSLSMQPEEPTVTTTEAATLLAHAGSTLSPIPLLTVVHPSSQWFTPPHVRARLALVSVRRARLLRPARDPLA